MEGKGREMETPFPLFECFENYVEEKGMDISPLCLDVIEGGKESDQGRN